MPFSVDEPSMTSRSLANALIACSALLLFHGTPSNRRKVNSFVAVLLETLHALHGHFTLAVHVANGAVEPINLHKVFSEIVLLQSDLLFCQCFP